MQEILPSMIRYGGEALAALIGSVVYFSLVRPYLREFGGSKFDSNFLALPFILVAVLLHTVANFFLIKLLANRDFDTLRTALQVATLSIAILLWFGLIFLLQKRKNDQGRQPQTNSAPQFFLSIVFFVTISGSLIFWYQLFAGLLGTTLVEIKLNNAPRVQEEFLSRISKYKKFEDTAPLDFERVAKLVSSSKTGATYLLQKTGEELSEWAYLFAPLENEDGHKSIEIKIPTDWLEEVNPPSQSGAEVREMTIFENEISYPND